MPSFFQLYPFFYNFIPTNQQTNENQNQNQYPLSPDFMKCGLHHRWTVACAQRNQIWAVIFTYAIFSRSRIPGCSATPTSISPGSLGHCARCWNLSPLLYPTGPSSPHVRLRACQSRSSQLFSGLPCLLKTRNPWNFYVCKLYLATRYDGI